MTPGSGLMPGGCTHRSLPLTQGHTQGHTGAARDTVAFRHSLPPMAVTDASVLSACHPNLPM